MSTPRFDLVVGPNGSGKSTFVRRYLSPKLPDSVFVNADEIASEVFPDNPEARSYDAAKIAERRRQLLIFKRRSFIAETVFSHPSKLGLISDAQAVGFRVVVHALLIPIEDSVIRVKERKALGGHGVPEDKIRSRAERVWPLVVQAASLSDRFRLYNNKESAMRLIAEFQDGELDYLDTVPEWTPESLRTILSDSSAT